MGLFDRIITGKKDSFAFQVGDELETKGDFPERYIIKDRKSSGGNNTYTLVNKSYSLDRKDVAEYELQRYYRLVNR